MNYFLVCYCNITLQNYTHFTNLQNFSQKFQKKYEFFRATSELEIDERL